MVQRELEAQRELVDYGGSFQPNAPPPCKSDVIWIMFFWEQISMNSHLFWYLWFWSLIEFSRVCIVTTLV